VFVRARGSWTQQAQLVAADGEAGDSFGASVSASGTAVSIGAPGAAANAGRAYVFSALDGTWAEAAEIAASDPSAGARFGTSLASAASELVSGAPGWTSDAGAAYLGIPVGGVWSQASELTAPDGGPGALFGDAVAVSGTLAVAGAPGEGALYVVTLPDPKAVLSASDASAGAALGASVAVAGGTAIVGAPGAASGAGAVDVFGASKHGWVQRATLTANDGAPGDAFGTSVSLSGKTLLVGAPGAQSGTGAVYVFEYSKNKKSWSQRARLTALDGAPGDEFGSAVSVADTAAFVGAPGSGGGAGAVYAFGGAGPDWAQVTEFADPKATAGDEYGQSVTVSDRMAVVGAPGTAGTGAAYAYFGSWTAWYFDAKLTAADRAQGDRFGTAVSVGDSSVLIGAEGHDAATGAAYVFERSGKWQQTAALLAVGGAPGDRFGAAVALSGATAVIGAEGAVGGAGAGASFVFVQSDGVWTQDTELSAPGGGTDGAAFGDAVGLSGRLVIVGAPGAGSAAEPAAGLAYLNGLA
jgi:hypothetical protein